MRFHSGAAAVVPAVLQEMAKPRAETIYAFDVVAPAATSSSGSSDDGSAAMPRLENRRVFAVTQSTKPDGIKVDSNGNGEYAVIDTASFCSLHKA
jgi:sugar lactone lactonase YvrE